MGIIKNMLTVCVKLKRQIVRGTARGITLTRVEKKIIMIARAGDQLTAEIFLTVV
jgi:hypothetical protein